MTDSWSGLALVHIEAGLLIRRAFLKALMTVAHVRSNCVVAPGIRGTHLELALVHVLTPAISGQHETNGTTADVSTLLILANLIRTTRSLSSGTLVHIHTPCSIFIRSVPSGTVQEILTPVRSVGVATTLMSTAGTQTTLVNVHTRSLGTALESWVTGRV